MRGLVADGVTVLLTTQYLEEADALADEITVIDHGRSIAHGTPDELKQIVGGQTILARPADRARLAETEAILTGVSGPSGRIAQPAAWSPCPSTATPSSPKW